MITYSVGADEVLGFEAPLEDKEISVGVVEGIS